MRSVAPVLTVTLLAVAALADPVREIEITPNPPEKDQQILNIRFTPGETVEYEKVTFDCVFHQEFPSEATFKTNSLTVHEPATFTYRRKDVKMVEDLDTHISFRVPLGLDVLVEKYGQTTFNTNYPVSISKIVITASGKACTWSCELPATGLHKPPFATPKSTRPQPKS